MKNLKTIEKKVRAVLEKNEDARNDDMVLYLALCNVCLKDAGAMPLAEIMTQHKYLGLPSFESVSRSTELVIGHNPNAPNPYVCWYCKGGSNYFLGYYTNEFDDARKKLNERYQSECRMPYNQPAQKQKNGDDRER